MRLVFPLSLGILFLFSAYSLVAAEWTTEKVLLPDLLKPQRIAFDNEQMYVTEQATVYIYGRKDFKLRKKFGTMGEGPQEFKLIGSGRIVLSVQPEELAICSLGKMSFFKKDGTFLEEIKYPIDGFTYMVDDHFVSFGVDRSGEIPYFTYTIYNPRFQKVTEIWRKESIIQARKKWKFFDRTSCIQVHDQKIFVSGGYGLEIDAFNIKGEKVLSIKHDYEKIKVTEKHREVVRNWYKNDPGLKMSYHIAKPWFWYPDYFPGIRDFIVTDNYIYVRTYAKYGEAVNESEFVIFTVDGEFIKKVFLPVIDKNANDTYPYTILGGRLYQLVEDIDDEEWVLHITSIPGIIVTDKEANEH